MKKLLLSVILILQLLLTVSAQNSRYKLSADSLCVIDKQSGLMWMKYDFSYTEKRFLQNWDECFTWQKNINRQRYAGYSDWQVPSISEYRTINRSKQDRENYHLNFAALDTVCIWGKGPYSFWSCNEKGRYNASYISFIDGFATSGDKRKQAAGGEWEGHHFGFSVRLVRKIKK